MSITTVSNTLKCKLCDYTVQKYYRGRHRLHTPEDAFNRLADHYMEKHEKEYDALQSKLDREFQEKERMMI